MAYLLTANSALGDGRYYVRVDRATGDYVLSAYVTEAELKTLIEMFKRLDEVLVVTDNYGRHG